MTTSPPDISQLSLNNNQQRPNDNYDYDGSRPQYHFATSPGLPVQSQYNPLTSSSPLKKPARSGLPTQWMDNPGAAPDNRSLSPQNNSDFSSGGGSPPMGNFQPPIAPGTPSQLADDEIIPTAIVIKNIPFNVKRETLLDIITSLSIPTPYAFNYHLDQQGSFRGLAFANFRQAIDADAVVAALNGFDVQGRKLRVEYKKVLQASEKERIEREKAIRRMRSMQIEKDTSISSPYEDYSQASPMPTPPAMPYTPQRVYSSGPYQTTYSPPPGLNAMPTSPFQMPPTPGMQQGHMSGSASDRASSNEIDLNDAATLEIYSRILLFKDDRMRDELAFSRSLSPKQRRTVHLLAQKLGVYHYSVGDGEDRYVVVTRIDPQRQQAPPQPTPTLHRVPSSYLSPSASQVPASIRVKKSMPDLKSLHAQAPRLTGRASNGNLREGYATIASPARRASSGFGSLFSGYGSLPPVPSLPANLGGDIGVMRQPRGPGVSGFRRDSRGIADGSARVRTDSLTGADGRGD